MAEFANLVKRSHHDLQALLQKEFNWEGLEIEFIASHYECVFVTLYIYYRARSSPKSQLSGTRVIYIRNYEEYVWCMTGKYDNCAEYLQKKLMAEQKMKQGLKQEIIAGAMHPDRVAKWVEAGIDLEDL